MHGGGLEAGGTQDPQQCPVPGHDRLPAGVRPPGRVPASGRTAPAAGGAVPAPSTAAAPPAISSFLRPISIMKDSSPVAVRRAANSHTGLSTIRSPTDMRTGYAGNPRAYL
ncbi:hypothetical protein Pflav_031020 [Phytohabitans flavus]|uniref:Uncharacterized protein n=1 Tax=Phytohabitans flavus TaxID=1076124 RepID=A0A6F8XS67_9ACTN|nr:hypothetical protein Pflav_031020 [Phytohabitans flavus]